VDVNKSEVQVGGKEDRYAGRWPEWTRVDQELQVDVSWVVK
jgi:hypothetical protein